MKVPVLALLCGTLSTFMLGLIVFPVTLVGQQGEKAVYKGVNSVGASVVWVDASAFCSGAGGTTSCDANSPTFDFCAVLASALTNALSTITPAGGVVDARGVLPAHPTASTELCNSNPFAGISAANSYPVTVLLPAFPIEITTPSTGYNTWVLPNNFKLVGTGLSSVIEGDCGCYSPALIEMGPAPSGSGSCSTSYSGIGVEHVQLITLGAFGGIDNECACTASYGACSRSGTARTSLRFKARLNSSGKYSSGHFNRNDWASRRQKSVRMVTNRELGSDVCCSCTASIPFPFSLP